MGRQVAISLLLLLFSSCYDSFSDLDINENDYAVTTANTTIEQLHVLYAAGMREVSSDLVIQGRVTANDEHGNIFKSFILEDNGYAVEILDGLYDSFVTYPIGQRVVVKLSGLGLDRYLGVLRIGLVAPTTSSYTLDYMSAQAIVDLYVEVDVSEPSLEPSPREISLSEADAVDAGRFIKINSLQLHTEDGVERAWEDYALFRDSNLDTIWCYTSSYADFADSKIPQGVVSLQGIFEFGDTDTQTDQFIIKLRSEEDCIY